MNSFIPHGIPFCMYIYAELLVAWRRSKAYAEIRLPLPWMIILALLGSQTKAAIADVCVRHAIPVHAIEYVKELHSEFSLYAVAKDKLLGQGDIFAIGRGQPQAFKYTLWAAVREAHISGTTRRGVQPLGKRCGVSEDNRSGPAGAFLNRRLADLFAEVFA